MHFYKVWTLTLWDFLKVCVAKIRVDERSLYFGTLNFLKVCMAKIRAGIKSLDFGTLNFKNM